MSASRSDPTVCAHLNRIRPISEPLSPLYWFVEFFVHSAAPVPCRTSRSAGSLCCTPGFLLISASLYGNYGISLLPVLQIDKFDKNLHAFDQNLACLKFCIHCMNDCVWLTYTITHICLVIASHLKCLISVVLDKL